MSVNNTKQNKVKQSSAREETHDRGVQAGRVENTWGTDESLGSRELGLKVALDFGSARGEGRAVVEALICGQGRRGGDECHQR